MDLQISPNTASGDGFVGLIPYLILILIVVAAGYYQSMQTMKRRKDEATTQTPQQQSMQNAMRFLPILFGVFSWNFPTGLVLYFATSNLFRVAQQAYILGLDKDETGTSGAAADKGSTLAVDEPVEPKPIARGPSPHASKKKRNRRRRK